MSRDAWRALRMKCGMDVLELARLGSCHEMVVLEECSGLPYGCPGIGPTRAMSRDE